MTELSPALTINQKAVLDHLAELHKIGPGYAKARAKQIAALDPYWANIPELLEALVNGKKKDEPLQN